MLGRLVGSGKVRPVVAEVFPLERAGEAFAAQEGGRMVGKVVIRVGEASEPGVGRFLGRMSTGAGRLQGPSAHRS